MAKKQGLPRVGLILWSVLFFLAAKVSDPVSVAVIDSFFDVNHRLLAPYFDEEAMKKLKTVDANGNPISWLELNNQLKIAFDTNMQSKMFQEQVDFLDTTENWSILSPIPFVDKVVEMKKIFTGLTKYFLSPSWRNHLDQVTMSLHGTHVAGLVVQSASPQKIKLIPYPASLMGVESKNQFQNLEIRDFKVWHEMWHVNIKNFIDLISKRLKDCNVKVVNMSFVLNIAEVRETIKKQFPAFSEKEMTKATEEAHLTLVKNFQRLFDENPEAVFVLAAGNDGKKLGSGALQNGVATIKAKNLVVVGALDRQKRLTKFSNYGSNFVNVAALGERVSSAKAAYFGDKPSSDGIYMSGTSMATPIVTNKIAEIRYENPEMSAEGSIKELLTKHTKTHAALSQQIEGGRFLPIDERLFNHVLNQKQGVKAVSHGQVKVETERRLEDGVESNWIQRWFGLAQQKSEDPNQRNKQSLDDGITSKVKVGNHLGVEQSLKDVPDVRKIVHSNHLTLRRLAAVDQVVEDLDDED